MAFRGRAEYSIDSKGRVAIPAKMRAAMPGEAGGHFVVLYGLDPCLMLYPENVWAEKEAEMMQHNQFRSETREAIRRLLSNTDETDIDGQGRVALSRDILAEATLAPSGTALLIGALDHIEVWNPEVFRARMNQRHDEAETLVERVMG